LTHFTSAERSAADALLALALVEDLGDTGDLTCHALIGPHIDAEVDVVARSSGVVAGMPICEQVFRKVDRHVCWIPAVSDGTRVLPGQTVARVAGRLSGILTGERTALNFLGCLSGIATLTSQYVDAIAGTSSVILDTRKTLPGWRVLAKYAVRAGGGCNHRMGLHDGVLIKDNHIAAWSRQVGNSSLAEAVRHARATAPTSVMVEVEVDTLAQFRDVISGAPDIVLLDNMTVADLSEAVAIRNKEARQILLEASGGITLETVRAIAETGVDRISVGALTHSAPNFDLGFDFHQITG
jgi:nicotinate-nucleotide pyrophosphorylase (carboxylating)